MSRYGNYNNAIKADMKNKLIELAKEKGFKGECIFNVQHPDLDYSVELTDFFLMCEIQKWLRDIHKIQIIIGHSLWSRKYGFKIFKSNGTNMHPKIIAKDEINTYELTIKLGLSEALKLI